MLQTILLLLYCTFSCFITKHFLWPAQTIISPSPKHSSFSWDVIPWPCIFQKAEFLCLKCKIMHRDGAFPHSLGSGLVAAVSGPHQDLLEEAKAPFLQEAGLDYLCRITEWFGLKGTHLKDHLVPTAAATGRETMQ